MTVVVEPARRELPVAMVVGLVAGAILISLAPLLVRVSELDSVATGFYRVALATPFLWLLVSSDPAPVRPMQGPIPVRDVMILCLTGLLLACDLGLWHIAIDMTSVANATILNNSSPIFVALFAWMAGRAPKGGFLAALLISLCGIALMIGGGFAFSPQQLRGDLLAIATGGFYGLYIILMERMRHRYSTVFCMAVSTSAAVPALFLFSVLRGEALLPSTAMGWLILLALGLVCHVGGQGLIARSLSVLPATFSSLVLLLQPVSAGILAWLLFGEAQTGWQILGMAAVLMGILLAARSVRLGKR